MASIEAHVDLIQSLAWSRDGNRLASGALGRVVLWSAADLRREREWTNGIAGRVTAMEFAPAGDTFTLGVNESWARTTGERMADAIKRAG